MADKTVFISDYTLDDDLDLEKPMLEAAGFSIVRAQCDTEEEVLAALEGVDPVALITQWAPITPAVMQRCPHLKVISRNGIGVDNIDLDYCREKGIVVTNSPRYCTEEVADHSLALALALLRKLVLTTDRLRAGEWGIDFLVPIHRLKTLTYGVIGLGGIGRAVVQRARPFFGHVIGHEAHAEEVVVDDRPVEIVSLDELLERADVVDLHVPGTDETCHLIDAEALAKMKPGALLINTCRGMVVDTEALVEALQTGKLGGAGLDVHEEEPLPLDHPLRTIPQVILTPHAAFYSEEAVQDARRDTVVNIVNVFAGKPPVNRVV